MSKDLPYFRFTASEWQNGDITLQGIDTQGSFINACCYYWLSDCSITLAKLKLRLNGYEALLDRLIKKGIIKHDEKTDIITISFLDEQFDLLSDLRIKRQKAGKKGGQKKSSKAKARLKQSPSYKDKEKENNNTEYSFDDFWNDYDKKRDKPDCLKVYAKVSEKDRNIMKTHIPLFKKSTPDKKYRPDPIRYLKRRGWEDEIIGVSEKQETKDSILP